MAYRRCRYCGYRGHNIRSCPSRPLADKKLDAPKKPKSCSWCQDTSHTRPKCEKLKADKANWVAQNAIYRKNLLQDLKKNNFNYGSIVKFPTIDDSFFIVSVDWDYIRLDSKFTYSIRVKYLEDFDRETSFCFPTWYGMEEGEEKEKRKLKRGDIIVQSTLNDTPIENKIPENWLNGSSGVEDAFRK